MLSKEQPWFYPPGILHRRADCRRCLQGLENHCATQRSDQKASSIFHDPPQEEISRLPAPITIQMWDASWWFWSVERWLASRRRSLWRSDEFDRETRDFYTEKPNLIRVKQLQVCVMRCILIGGSAFQSLVTSYYGIRNQSINNMCFLYNCFVIIFCTKNDISPTISIYSIIYLCRVLPSVFYCFG